MDVTTKLVKLALRRENDGTPTGQPAPLYLMCPCGTKVPARDKDLGTINPDKDGLITCKNCGAKYDAAGTVAYPGYIGRYARSIESGWKGKVIGIEEFNGEKMLKMMGYNWLNHEIAGGSIDEHLDLDDVQWFTVEDVKFLKVV